MVITIHIIPLTGIPIVSQGDDLSSLILQATSQQRVSIKENDIIVVTHVIVSRAEGSTIDLNTVVPSEFAKKIGEKGDKDPAVVEVVLREAESIVRMREGSLITRTKHGFICANSGVDQSNVPGEKVVALLPKDPDRSAREIRKQIELKTGKKVAVIVSDTHGRPLRDGEINVAIGVAGLNAIRDRRGDKDLFGYTLRIKRTAIADELASAAELVMGQGDEAIPVALIRGYRFNVTEDATARDIVRPVERELFL